MQHTLILIFAVVSVSAANIVSADPQPTVKTSRGTITGFVENNIRVFKGIPFAQPPIKEQRWQPPKPVAISNQTIIADKQAPACPQPRRTDTSEDCLYLNIWAPNNREKNRPVMVWIHGGGFIVGSSDVNGAAFAEKGAVVVSISYRLGPLGFFAHDKLPNQPANFALLDMQQALVWVKENIAAFDGDPNNVTIFGVSAGGMAVNMLMVNPDARGLFNKAIAQSGYATWPLSRTRKVHHNNIREWSGEPVAIAEQLGKETIQATDANATTLEQMKTIPAESLVNTIRGFQIPIVDGFALTDEPAVVFAQGKQHKVPYMTGGNSNEGSVMPGTGISMEEYQSHFASAQQVASLYNPDQKQPSNQDWQRMFGDQRYLLSAHVLANHMHNVAPTWLYYVDFVPKQYQGQWLGTPHGVDSYFLWQGDQSEDQEVVALNMRMRDFWYQFALTSNPNNLKNSHQQTGYWPNYDTKNRRWLVFSDQDEVQEAVLLDKLTFLTHHYNGRFK